MQRTRTVILSQELRSATSITNAKLIAERANVGVRQQLCFSSFAEPEKVRELVLCNMNMLAASLVFATFPKLGRVHVIKCRELIMSRAAPTMMGPQNSDNNLELIYETGFLALKTLNYI